MKEQERIQLKQLELQLKNEVDADFFLDPQHFRTLPRVIDILGAQLLESDPTHTNNGGGGGALSFAAPSSIRKDHKAYFDNLHKNNPAYTSLRKQQQVVEEAIEHLSLVHYKDLNASVVAVGQVSRRFGEAVDQVKGLRAQVQEIREHLTNASVGGGEPGGNHSSGGGAAERGGTSRVLGGQSLRELWLKKLESEAVLSLLQKLEVVRRTPGAFDLLVHSQPCRIGAAVVLLSDAIETMFTGDVAQIQGLNKITEQLMTRKQKAEEIVWETLQDVIYLRTGNYTAEIPNRNALQENDMAFNPTSIHIELESGMSDYNLKYSSASKMDSGASSKRRMTARSDLPQHDRRHVYISSSNQRAATHDNDDESDESIMFSDEYSSKSGQSSADKRLNRKLGKSSLRKSVTVGSYFDAVSANHIFANFHGHQGQLIPKAMIDSEVDLEADELRCLETFGNATFSSFSNDGTLVLPRYNDPILSLRILVEALAKLKRLDDVERCISENIDREIRKIAEAEQAKTLAKLEKRKLKDGNAIQRNKTSSLLISSDDSEDDRLKDFRMHLKSLLTSFGSVMLRLNHLAQILRHRIMSDPTIVTPSYSSPSSALHGILVAAHVKMQREIKSFLHGCLNEDEKLESAFQSMRMVTPSMMGMIGNRYSRSLVSASNVQASDRGIFSLGIINDASFASSYRDKHSHTLSLATRSSIMKMSSEEYAVQVLCPRTGIAPQIRHALTFRKGLAAWTKECSDLKSELAIVSREDTSTPEYNATTEETALAYLDKIIQKTLLPMMQDAAVNGTITALERPDAFEPITNTGIYSSPGKGTTSKPSMCAACQGLYNSTGPLFSALLKLPRGGEMYSPIVAVLEHSILTFLSRVKQRILELCDGKKAFVYLEEPHSKHSTKLSMDMEARRSFALLWNAYFDEGSLGSIEGNAGSPNGRSMIHPISPPANDTKSKNNIEDDKSAGIPYTDRFDNNIDQTQREQESFEQEVSHLLDILNFIDPRYGNDFKLCSEGEFARALSLSHSLLELSSLLEQRLKPKKSTWGNTVIAPRSLRDSIKNIRLHGFRLAKFSRIEVLLQIAKRIAGIYQSSTLTAKDAVRLPTCISSIGDYLSSISDQMRENVGSSKVIAYTLSSLEQYVPLFLMETVRIIAVGEGLPPTFKISLHGVEALDKCCSVLYKDLKSATGFENSFWDESIAADAFDRAASYVALMELDMDELMSYWRNNRDEFTDDDYRIMFGMNGPNRRGDIKKYAALKESMM